MMEENLLKSMANAPDDLVKQAKPYIAELTKGHGLPPFGVSLPEDNTLLIEWDFEHFTIGLSFEHNPDESSWYIVTDGKIRSTTDWGLLNDIPMSDLVKFLIVEAVRLRS